MRVLDCVAIDESLEHPVLRLFLQEFATSSSDHLLALLNETGQANVGQAELTVGVFEVRVRLVDSQVEVIDLIGESGSAAVRLDVFLGWVRNIAAVTPRLRNRIRRDFGDGSFNEVLWALGCLPASDSAPGERLAAAALLYASGDWYRLRDVVCEANLDFRDALVLGGLADVDWRNRIDAEFT